MRKARALALVASFGLGCGATSAPAGSVPERHGCRSDDECAPGLACCYPCGVEGCENACLPVTPGEGCPAIP